MIFNSQGDATLRQYINGQTITPGKEEITLPGNSYLLGDVVIAAADTEAAYQEGYNAGHTAGYNEGYAVGYETGINEERPYAQKLQYLESTGTQWINTAFNATSNSRIVFDFQSTGPSNDSIKAMFGARLNNDTKCFDVFALPTTVYPQYGANAYDTRPITANISQRLTYDFNANKTTVGSTTVSFTPETFSTGYPIYLFTLNDNGNPDSRYIKGRLYSCQIYDNGILVRDYIPVLDFSGVACLYDKVGGSLYYNRGSGAFSYAA